MEMGKIVKKISNRMEIRINSKKLQKILKKENEHAYFLNIVLE